MTKPIQVINWSEFSTLANCETQWGYAYLLGNDEPGDKLALHKGTLIHLGLDRWTQGLGATLPEVWTDDINTGGKPGEIRTLHLSDFDSQLVQDVQWLLARYELVYGSQPPSSWNVISTEEWLTGTIRVGSRKLRIVGRHDGLIEVAGGLWLIERKSYGQRGRLDTVQAELQSVIYHFLIQAKYKRQLTGILYDGVYTHRFVPKAPTQTALIEAALLHGSVPGFPYGATKTAQTNWARLRKDDPSLAIERDPADSFERVWIDHTPQQIEMALTILAASMKRRNAIKTLDDTIPHVGRACSWCGFKDKCWARLTGVQDIELVEGWDEQDNSDVPV
jgi:hypothetical protein